MQGAELCIGSIIQIIQIIASSCNPKSSLVFDTSFSSVETKVIDLSSTEYR